MGAIGTRPATAVSEYCREAGSTLYYGLYRAKASSDSYALTIGDSGTALLLAPSVSLDDLGSAKSGKPKSWTMSMLGRDAVGVPAMFNRLPPPEQALAVYMSNPPGMSMSVGSRRD